MSQHYRDHSSHSLDSIKYKVETLANVKPHLIFWDGTLEGYGKNELKHKMQSMFDALKDKYNVYFFEYSPGTETVYDLSEVDMDVTGLYKLK